MRFQKDRLHPYRKEKVTAKYPRITESASKALSNFWGAFIFDGRDLITHYKSIYIFIAAIRFHNGKDIAVEFLLMSFAAKNFGI